MIQNFDQLLETALNIQRKSVTVIFPNNEETFQAIIQAKKFGISEFLLVGDESVIKNKLIQHEQKIEDYTIVHQSSSTGALHSAIELIRDNRSDILMKGGIDTSAMMKAVLREDAGIRVGRLLSDVFIFEFPLRVENKLIMITDGGINLYPDLKEKIELIRTMNPKMGFLFL